jgi:hypothetical protein
MNDCDGREEGMEKFEHKKALKYNDLKAFSEFLRRERALNPRKLKLVYLHFPFDQPTLHNMVLWNCWVVGVLGWYVIRRIPIIILCKVGAGQTFPFLASFADCSSGSANGNYRATLNCGTLARCSTDDGCDQRLELYSAAVRRHPSSVLHCIVISAEV